MRFLPVLIVLAGPFMHVTFGQFEFNFVAVDNQKVLATLELDRLENVMLPNVVDFDFTPAGRELFGYPGGYQGEFDEMRDGPSAFWFYDEFDMRLSGRGDGGINNQASLFDFDAPLPAFDNAIQPATIQLIAGDAGGLLRLSYLEDTGDGVLIQPQGDWLLVPEPMDLSPLLFSSLGFAAICRRRRLPEPFWFASSLPSASFKLPGCKSA